MLHSPHAWFLQILAEAPFISAISQSSSCSCRANNRCVCFSDDCLNLNLRLPLTKFLFRRSRASHLRTSPCPNGGTIQTRARKSGDPTRDPIPTHEDFKSGPDVATKRCNFPSCARTSSLRQTRSYNDRTCKNMTLTCTLVLQRSCVVKRSVHADYDKSVLAEVWRSFPAMRHNCQGG